MLPPYLSVNQKSKAGKWAGTPCAVYEIDMDALMAMRDKGDIKSFNDAIDSIMSWLETYDGDHDAWVATPSTFFFTEKRSGQSQADGSGSDSKNEERDMACIANCIIPIKYTVIDMETTVKCMLTCTDGAPFVQNSATHGEWTCFCNDSFYHKQEARQSENSLYNLLFLQRHDVDEKPFTGPVVFTCF